MDSGQKMIQFTGQNKFRDVDTGMKFLLFLFPLHVFLPHAAVAWEKKDPAISTPWFDEVTPGNAHAEYPRPQMVRQQWQSLNGLWEFAVMGEGGSWEGGRVENAKADLLKGNSKLPADFDREILVPFSPETALSGIGEEI
jgi:hypothetical protein